MTGAQAPIATTPVDGALVAEVLRSRRTIHDFLPEPVPESLILKAIEIARWAPNHHRTEPWRFYLLGPAARERIAALNAGLVREAKGEKAAEVKLRRWQAMPGWLVLTCPRNEDRLREREDYAACCCAAQNMMLYLWAEGVGMKWTTGRVTRLDEFQDIVGMPRGDEFVVGLFWYGWPASVTEQHRRPPEGAVTHVD